MFEGDVHSPVTSTAPVPLQAVPDRDDWLNTYVGVLDQAFHLTETEQVYVISTLLGLLEVLRVPERSDPVTLPPAVALEVSDRFYTRLLDGPRSSGVVRPVRFATGSDIVVSVEAWKEALVEMLTIAHVDITPSERLMAAKVFVELLAAIGVPGRAASFFPDEVVRLSRVIDAPDRY